jgi:hypothetical protein
MIDQQTRDDFAKAMQELVAAAQESCEKLAAALHELTEPFAAALEQVLKEIQTGEILEPRQKLPRPPKYAGPANKGRTWSRQPPRLARSHCRKNRR